MTEITPAEWDALVASHQDVEAAAEAAYHAYVGASDGARAALQARCEQIGRVYDQQQQRLLRVEPPTLGAAAYQLRLFALGYHLGDPAEPALADDAREITVLRRIYLSLNTLAERMA